MANTRKPLLNFLAAGQNLLPDTLPPRLAVAFSGGRDSSVLLDLLAQRREISDLQLFAFHIHHGLQAQADAWLEHCAAFAAERDVPFFFQRVQVKTSGQGIEAAAREARYAALRGLAQQHHIPVIALAHHANDQAETVLFNLARGAGSAGLAAMPQWREDVLPGAPTLRWWRPLLHCSAEVIAAYAQQQQLRFIDDPSNDNLDFTRNHLRHKVLPALQQALPSVVAGISRAARHAAQSAELEQQAGAFVLQQLEKANNPNNANNPNLSQALPIAALQKLAPALRNATLRTWLKQLQLPALSEARLNDWWQQISSARADAQVRVPHGDGFFCCYRGWMYFEAHQNSVSNRTQANRTQASWQWQAQQQWRLAQWNGEFVFTPLFTFSAAQPHTAPTSSIPEHLLLSQLLHAKPRQGGERLRLQANGHSRPLKQWYQTYAVPAWQRDTPLLYLGNELLFVPGVGLAAQFHAQPGTPRWSIAWRPL